MMAYALAPTFSFSRFAEFVVMTDTISSLGATSIVTSVLTGPVAIADTVPLKALRAS